MRCAVAFWGNGAVDRLFSSELKKGSRIVCDISLGATNPCELRAMGAPENKKLRHLNHLHAKVYISDKGAVVCSANASDNGIGFIDTAGLVEAGILIGPEDSEFARVKRWFKGIWKRSSALDEQALDEAEERWSRRPARKFTSLSAPQLNRPSLLAEVAANPQQFRGIGFVFTTRTATEENRDEVTAGLQRADGERSAKLLSRSDRKKLSAWPLEDLFVDWNEEDICAWPRRFVCIHRPHKRTYYSYYRREHEMLVGPDRGVVFATRPKGFRAELGFEHGSDAMLVNDATMLDRLFAKCMERDRWLYENGDSLARLIEEIGANSGS